MSAKFLQEVVAKKEAWRSRMAKLDVVRKFEIADQLYAEALEFREARRNRRGIKRKLSASS